jgi:hypothetical protein
MTSEHVRIGSAIFNADHGHLADAVTGLDRAGIDFIHWDVFDAHFIPDLGFPPRTLQAVRSLTQVPFEVHLAVADLRTFIAPLAKAGANYMNSQLIRMEAVANGYHEGIALDANGLVSEGSGENIFLGGENIFLGFIQILVNLFVVELFLNIGN